MYFVAFIRVPTYSLRINVIQAQYRETREEGLSKEHEINKVQSSFVAVINS